MKIEEFYTAIRHKNDPATYAEVVDQLDDEKYALLQARTLTTDTRFYLKQFIGHMNNQLFISRNIPAIIFGPGWFAFRRMYLHAFILFIVGGVATIALYEYVVGDYIAYIINAVVGVFGNALYFQNVKRRSLKGYRSEGSAKSCVIYILIQTVISIAVVLGLVSMGWLKLF
ncbi:DUF2628 domain-containing protein [Candidatus Bodocaedibacter vickermanii]|uniref:DUF2628 domain-containing protein n=1 Tax=Candidatus Bodocaedibacter vickermanii TaxID=2741701 RepID=A0A7L9RT28_9PROT|nr:DUF2628 domain-containing protein [Candidatus Paracaedibacteraceae bacterium 'Lake Konstanz']